MIVGAARNYIQTLLLQAGRQRAGIFDYSMGVKLEFRLHCFGKCDCLCSDYMHQRPALKAGEDSAVHFFRERFVVRKDHAGARPTERFVRRRRHDMGVRDGRGVRAACNQP